MIIMSMFSPRKWNTHAAASTDDGMTTAATSAARQLPSSAPSASTTNT